MALSKPIINMTADLLRIIVRQCEYPAIQILRKTSATVRDLIDRRLPNGSVYAVSIKSCTNSIFIEIKSGNPSSPSSGQLYPRGNRIKIEYQFHKKGCMVILERRGGRKSQRFVKDESFVTVFWKDFESLLDINNGKVLEDFKVNFEMIEWGKTPKKNYFKFIAQLEEVIKKRGYLRTRNISMRIFMVHECRSILALMDPRTSKLIEYSRMFDSFVVEELEQWKNARMIQSENFEFFWERGLFHFEKVKVRMDYVSGHNVDGIVQSNLSENIVEVFFSPNSFQVKLVKNSDVPPGLIKDWIPRDQREEIIDDFDDSDTESDDDSDSDDDDDDEHL
ncbi:Protein CBG18504 [Caenorhabditis briggsae]|uniref:Protein CBG18504 n=1 Tax=Caenorhabditis briggsae TaxID=6238 RepID=A8XTG3_CAEBR|nr:Protein CBG18504 [Caenorhabditis briggsae]CAP35940.1 Protein CBG18504 [Caenorhabditis briggsae]